MADQNPTTTGLTPEQTQTLITEIEGFQTKSIEYAASNPFLSGYYGSLYKSVKYYQDKLAKKARIEKDRQAAEKRKAARKGTGTPASGKSA